MELLVCCVFAYWLVKHLPEVAAETAQAIGYGLRGEESPAAAARRQRLEDAGLDPAAGGAFGQYTGNLWRDFWLDQDNARRARRASKPESDSDTGQGWRARWDARVDGQAAKWRRRNNQTAPEAGTAAPEGNVDSDPPPTAAGGTGGPFTPTGGGRFYDDPGQEPGDTEPIRVKATVGEPADRTTRPGDTGRPELAPGRGPERPGAGPTTTPAGETPTPLGTQPARGPIRVDATVGQPARTPTATAVLEPAPEQGETMSATVATRGIPVTGVASGAAECMSINRELDTAIAEFHARLANIAARTHSMGEQTLGIVQFAGRSDVVVRMAQAAEAIAATKAATIALGHEVGPLLRQTRGEFLRRA